MITAHYNYSRQTGLFAMMAQQNQSKVDHQDANSPILEQWHHLIDAIRSNANPRQWVTLVNPPFIPNDRYLRDIGLSNHYIRVVRLSQNAPDTEEYIQQCVQNGKSSLVAIWADGIHELPDVLQDEGRLSCRTLVFSSTPDVPVNKEPQLTFAF